jgi:hypothetical protein
MVSVGIVPKRSQAICEVLDITVKCLNDRFITLEDFKRLQYGRNVRRRQSDRKNLRARKAAKPID